uniref:Glucagon / GIP / secretin / VIP family domain-containing protein n=1 Tax=Sparus aurata TaxID=8175 RepID=A0A671XRL9_SPAAU
MFVFNPNCALHLLLMFLIRSNIAKTLLNCFWIISDMSQMTRLLREEIRWERSVSQSQMVSVTAEHTQRPLRATLKERTTQHSDGTFTSDFTHYLDKIKAKDFVEWLATMGKDRIM